MQYDALGMPAHVRNLMGGGRAAGSSAQRDQRPCNGIHQRSTPQTWGCDHIIRGPRWMAPSSHAIAISTHDSHMQRIIVKGKAGRRCGGCRVPRKCGGGDAPISNEKERKQRTWPTGSHPSHTLAGVVASLIFRYPHTHHTHPHKTQHTRHTTTKARWWGGM
jgi:hypothetical protein